MDVFSASELDATGVHPSHAAANRAAGVLLRARNGNRQRTIDESEIGDAIADLLHLHAKQLREAGDDTEPLDILDNAAMHFTAESEQ